MKRTSIALIFLSSLLTWAGAGWAQTNLAVVRHADNTLWAMIWTRKANMNTAREALVAAAVNNRIYAIGGAAGPTTMVGVNEEFDATTDTWTGKATMAAARITSTAAGVGNKVYVIGGSEWPVASALRTNEEFTPELLYVHKKN